MKSVSVSRSLCCCLLLMAGVPLHGHVFTNPDGKTFEGAILNGNEKTVTIERSSDKKSFTIERKRLSEADQAAVAEWILANPVIRLSVKTVKKSKDIESARIGAKPIPGECYEIEIRNESAQATPELTLRYLLRETTRSSTRSGNSSVSMHGNVDVIAVPSIPPFRSTVLPSRSVVSVKKSSVSTEATRLSDGRVRIDTESSKSKSGLNGISLVVYHENRKVAQHALMGMEKQTEQLLQQGNPSTVSP